LQTAPQPIQKARCKLDAFETTFTKSKTVTGLAQNRFLPEMNGDKPDFKA
jgi:hypothetical protein